MAGQFEGVLNMGILLILKVEFEFGVAPNGIFFEKAFSGISIAATAIKL